MRMRFSAIAVSFLSVILLTSIGALAVTDITQDAEVKADPETVKAIRGTFDRAEEALHTKSLSGLMAIYSKDYQNRGLRKTDTALIWQDIFARYDQLSSRHVFSKIVVQKNGSEPPSAQVTCTGVLFGVSVLKKGKPAPAAAEKPFYLDAWFETTHYLVLENGDWKIIGHDPSMAEEHPFAAALHLLF
jgi:hypothetical protein